MTINGNIDSIKKSILERLEDIYDYLIEDNQMYNNELIIQMCEITRLIHREVCVLIDRKGNVIAVSVGHRPTPSPSEVNTRRTQKGLTGIRCIHTHPNGNPHPSDVDISALRNTKMDAMISVAEIINNDGEKVYATCIAIISSPDLQVDILGPFKSNSNISSISDEIWNIIHDTDKAFRLVIDENIKLKERAILLGIETPKTKVINGISEKQVSIIELKELAETAGAEVVQSFIQKRAQIDSAFFTGRGKLEELRLSTQAQDIDILIIDEELSGAQQRNIEQVVGIKVIDRTSLILDIFAQRARSKEGKLQVELAQLNYMLPRLTGLGVSMSRIGGGIGTRGPGETKLESDKRHIRRRIDYLKQELFEVEKQRGIIRKSREKNKIPVAALVGYTNAGKSTLLNKLCNSDVFAEDKLVATLDPTTR